MQSFRRLAGWNQRFWLCWERLGLRNTMQIFFRGRIAGKDCVLRLPGGYIFHFEGGRDGVVCHFYLEGLRLLESGEFPIRRILDGGANIGTETLRFLLHHPQAEVAAVEVAGRNFRLLHRNFEWEARVKVIHAALWPEAGELRVRQYGQDMQEFRVEAGPEGEAVEGLTIPQVMELMGWQAIDVLKLDIEGAEYELFTRNFEGWIDRVNAFVFEVPDHDRPGTVQAIFKALGGSRYNAYVSGENLVLVKEGLGWQVEKVLGVES